MKKMFKNILFTLIIFYSCLDIQEVRLIPTSENINTNTNNTLTNQINKIPPNLNNPSISIKNTNVNVTNITKSNTVNTAAKVDDNTGDKKDEKGVKQQLHQIPTNTNLQLTSDAFLRGFYVLIGFGAIVLIYLGVKTVRVNKPPTPNTTVRKYGVKARRGDLEMLPLPLDDEDDDDTVFEVGNQLRTDN